MAACESDPSPSPSGSSPPPTTNGPAAAAPLHDAGPSTSDAAGADAAGEDAGAGDGGDGGDAGAPIVPVAGDRFVGPSGSDDANDCQVESTPCLTILHASTAASAGQSIWLLDGTHGATATTIKAGVALRARHAGLAIVPARIKIAGSTVSGIVFDAGNGTGAGIDALAGTNLVEGPRFKGRYTTPGLRAQNDAVVTLTTGGVTNYVAETLAISPGNTFDPILAVEDTASLSVIGGSFDGPGMGHGSPLAPSGNGAAIWVRDSGHLTLDGVKVVVHTRGIAITHGGTVSLKGQASIMPSEIASVGYAIGVVNDNVDATIHLDRAALDGFAASAQGYGVALLGVSQHPRAVIDVTQTVFTGDDVALYVATTGKMTLTGQALGIVNSRYGGIRCDGACDVDLADSQLTGSTALTTVAGPFHGGLWMGSASVPYHLKLRGSSVTAGHNDAALPGANVEDNSGLVLAGDATSTFDLGTGASPGGNLFEANSSGASSTNLAVRTSAAVVVSAVGNRWDAGVQGTDAAKHFNLGTAPCGPAACDVTSGTGANYRVSSGTLRLAQ